MKQNKQIVFIGGGTGLSNILKGAKKYSWDISAIVAMTDDGLSTGRIRKEFKTLPPGDLRKCLIALSSDEILSQVFNYRFSRGKGLARHSLGNLIILSLEKITGSYKLAIKKAAQLLNIKGQVIPSTLENINLGGILENKRKIIGERKLFLAGIKSKIKKVWLVPEKVKANPEALNVISRADTIVIGPGSFYTSIITNLLLPDLKNAIVKNKKAKKIYICNASTERGETQGFSVEDHIIKLKQYSHEEIIDTCLVNNKIISQSKKEYKLGEIKNITTDKKYISNIRIVAADFIDHAHPLYHDPKKTVRKIWELTNEKKK